MKIGLLFDMRNPVQWERPWAEHYARTLEFCEEADRLGIGGIWFTEHHRFEDGYLPQPLTFAAAAAARTKYARIGTSVVIPALRHPAQLAEEAAIVDLVSGGRLELGIGAGNRIPEFELFNVPFERPIARAGKAVEAIQRLWDEGLVTPLPLQENVPIWGGFYGPRGARMAGRLGIGLLHVSGSMFEHYVEGMREAGRGTSAARVSGLVPMVLADDPEAAWVRIAPHLAHQKNTYRQGWSEGSDRPKLPWLEPDPASEELRGMLHVLTPDEAAERITALTRGLPVEHLIFWASIAGMPDDLVISNMRLLTEKLVPLLS